MKIEYVIGDATEPKYSEKEGNLDFIVHCCNDIGAWGAGFVMALSKKWPQPQEKYIKWYKNRESSSGKLFKQGQIQIVDTPNPDILVVNIIGQSGTGHFHELPPVRYGAIEEGLIRLRQYIVRDMRNYYSDYTINMPRIGCGLAGGSWDKIEDILNRVFKDTDINIVVYDFKG